MEIRLRAHWKVGLMAFAVGVPLLVACTRGRESSKGRSPAVMLELQVVGDPIIASAGASFVVPVRLRNVGSKPETLMFSSSCSFQVAIATLDGRELARPDAICLSVIREPTIDPGEALQEFVAYTMGEPGVVRLALGAYRITPILLAISKHAVGTQTVRLEVRAAKPTDSSMELSRP